MNIKNIINAIAGLAGLAVVNKRTLQKKNVSFDIDPSFTKIYKK